MSDFLVIAGDSIFAFLQARHVAQIEAALPGISVADLAVGGSTAADVARHLDAVLALDPVAVLLSAGLNDAAQRVPVAEFVRTTVGLARRVPVPWIHLLPPTTDPALTTDLPPEMNDTLVEYRRALRAHPPVPGRSSVDPDRIAGVDPEHGRLPDGVHLTDDAYDALLPALIDSVRRVTSAG